MHAKSARARESPMHVGATYRSFAEGRTGVPARSQERSTGGRLTSPLGVCTERKLPVRGQLLDCGRGRTKGRRCGSGSGEKSRNSVAWQMLSPGHLHLGVLHIWEYYTSGSTRGQPLVWLVNLGAGSSKVQPKARAQKVEQLWDGIGAGSALSRWPDSEAPC